MSRMRLATAVLAVAWPSLAPAGMVSARWGVKGRLAHPGAVQFASAGDGATVMVVDLSALPAGAAIYRARLRHSERANFSWADGHVEAFTLPYVSQLGWNHPDITQEDD